MIYLLAISLLLLTVISVLAVARSNLRTPVIYLLIPFLIFNLGFGWHTMEELKGRPAHSEIDQEMEFLFALVAKPTIYILVREKNSSEPKYYAVPYSDKNEEAIRRAMEAVKKGSRMMLRPGTKNFLGERNNFRSFEFYQFQHEHAMPKTEK
jgi:hypothetical protein